MSANETSEMEPVDTSSLRKELPPPPELEQRVLTALANRGLIRRSADGKSAWMWLAIAASICLFCTGVWAGDHYLRSFHSPPTYVFLLYEGAGFQQAGTRDDENRRINEYKNWARELRGRHVVISGMKLGEDMHIISASLASERGDPNSKVAGFFEVHVRTLEEALSIARTCPNIRYGGKIEVRPIENV